MSDTSSLSQLTSNTGGTWLTIDQLADRSGLPKSLLYQLKKDGVIPFLQRCPGGKIRFPTDAVERAMAWLRSRAASTPSSVETSATEPISLRDVVKPKRLPGRRPRWEDRNS